MCVVVLVFIVRSPEGKLSLFCKGADTIIYERLHQSCSKLMDVTTEHLNVRNNNNKTTETTANANAVKQGLIYKDANQSIELK